VEKAKAQASIRKGEILGKEEAAPEEKKAPKIIGNWANFQGMEVVKRGCKRGMEVQVAADLLGGDAGGSNPRKSQSEFLCSPHRQE